jgi:hypothetical protein
MSGKGSTGTGLVRNTAGHPDPVSHRLYLERTAVDGTGHPLR